MEKTYLDVPDAHSGYAERFGAIFDRSERCYFVVGDVPPELYSYVPKVPRQRNFAAEVPEQCTVCGAAMELRERRRDRALYYRCASCLNTARV